MPLFYSQYLPPVLFRFVVYVLAAVFGAYSSILGAKESNNENNESTAPVQTIEQVEVTAKQQKESNKLVTTKVLLTSPGATLDPLSAIQNLPGVTAASDWGSEPVVRGSSPNANNYRIDTIPADYIFHTFGTSIFDESSIDKFELHSAAFASQYGNATGAIIDVSLKDPENQPFTSTLYYSLLRAGAFFESGIGDNQAFYLSYRKSTIDLYYSPEDEENEDGVKIDRVPVETDYLFKYRWRINNNNDFTVLVAGAEDEVAATLSENSNEGAQDPDTIGPASIDKHFNSQGIIWKYRSDDNTRQLTTTVNHSKDQFDLRYGSQQFKINDNESFRVATQAEFRMNASQTLLFGGSYEERTPGYHLDAKIIPCSEFNPDCDVTDAPRITLDTELDINHSTLYAEWEQQINDTFSVTGGLHASSNDYLDESFYEPRISARYRLNPTYSVIAAVGEHHRFPETEHIVPDIGNPRLKSPRATHYTIGLQRATGHTWGWQIDLYYKDLKDQIMSLDEEHDSDYQNNYSNEGSGEACGFELLINRQPVDRWSGWLSISYARSRRENGRTGQDIPFEYDRPLMATLIANYQWNELWTIAAKWRVQSGALYTPIIGLQESKQFPGVQNPIYGETYSERASLYHRLDIRIERFKAYPSFDYTLYFDILNLYNQDNAEAYYYAPNNRDLVSPPSGYADNIPVAKETGMSFFPSIGVKFTF